MSMINEQLPNIIDEVETLLLNLYANNPRKKFMKERYRNASRTFIDVINFIIENAPTK